MKRRALAYTGPALAAVLIARAVIRRATAYDLRGKVVMITGGSRGLGLILARELVTRGARVAICARDAAELERARAELATRGEVLAIVCDITDRRQLERLVADVRDRLGPIDVLINNAGIIQVGPAALMSDADYRRAMETHFWAPLHLVQAVLPDMLAREAGRIVNITSIGGKVAIPHLLPYTASKFALVGLSEGLHVELAKHGIAVTTVVPGLMRTGSPVHARFKGRQRAEYLWFAIGDSLHVTSMNAERAARRIVRAMRYGEPEVVLSPQAKIVRDLAALTPNLLQRMLAIVDRLLPAHHGTSEREATGLESRTETWLTRSTDRAARRNNEL